MTCYHHLPAWRDPSGGFHFGYNAAATELLNIPCGKCEGCKQDRATSWAHRCEHEAKHHTSNTFLLLTYNDDHLGDGSLRPRDLQLFFKRLRKSLPQRIKYFACGEYGPSGNRPHYHALIFNWLPTDLTKVGASNGRPLYQADCVGDLWPLGLHKLGIAEAGAAGYIAKYALKGMPTGDHRQPPFLRMSKGIGKAWLEKYNADLQHGYLIQGSTKQRIPRYYRKLIERDHIALHDKVKASLKHYNDAKTTHDYRYERARQYDAQRIHKQKNERLCNR